MPQDFVDDLTDSPETPTTLPESSANSLSRYRPPHPALRDISAVWQPLPSRIVHLRLGISFVF